MRTPIWVSRCPRTRQSYRVFCMAAPPVFQRALDFYAVLSILKRQWKSKRKNQYRKHRAVGAFCAKRGRSSGCSSYPPRSSYPSDISLPSLLWCAGRAWSPVLPIGNTSSLTRPRTISASPSGERQSSSDIRATRSNFSSSAS